MGTDPTANCRQRLCVFGAGNCNDIDLTQLLRRFSTITLVDLDESAMRAGACRQDVADNPAIDFIGDFDVTGGLLDRIAPHSATKDLTQLIEFAARSDIALKGNFDVVASTCVLSQIINMVTNTVHHENKQFGELLLTIRARHLRLIVELCSPGGRGLFISDFVSSYTQNPRPGLLEAY